MVRSTGRNSSIEKILNWVECIKGIYFYTRTIPFQCKGEKCGTHAGNCAISSGGPLKLNSDMGGLSDRFSESLF